MNERVARSRQGAADTLVGSGAQEPSQTIIDDRVRKCRADSPCVGHADRTRPLWRPPQQCRSRSVPIERQASRQTRLHLVPTYNDWCGLLGLSVGFTGVSSLEKKAPERDGLIVLFIFGGIEEGHRTSLCLFLNRGDQCRLLFQLGMIPVTKFGPSCWIVVEPLPEDGRWA